MISAVTFCTIIDVSVQIMNPNNCQSPKNLMQAFGRSCEYGTENNTK